MVSVTALRDARDAIIGYLLIGTDNTLRNRFEGEQKRLGIEMARAARPDVILMDINLPGISGLIALGILAEDPETASIPVIALSANAMPDDIEKGLAAGFFRYLTKPIKVNKFMDTLDSALAVVQHQVGRAAALGGA
jgi:CheY-like chemotaxis protein